MDEMRITIKNDPFGIKISGNGEQYETQGENYPINDWAVRICIINTHPNKHSD